jgi:hypothetical protein
MRAKFINFALIREKGIAQSIAVRRAEANRKAADIAPWSANFRPRALHSTGSPRR